MVWNQIAVAQFVRIIKKEAVLIYMAIFYPVLYDVVSISLSNSTNIMFWVIIHRLVFIYKHRPVYFSKHNVSETRLSLSSGKTYSVGPYRYS
jgi:hypothetical protein